MFNKGFIAKIAATLGVVALAAGLACASAPAGPSVSPEEALQKLIEGNKRYVENQMTGSLPKNTAWGI